MTNPESTASALRSILHRLEWEPATWTASGWDTSTAKRITAGADLQAALDAAKPGDTLLLEAGATWTGNYKLPAKSGDAPITVASAAYASLPPIGVRVTPAHAQFMPRIVAPQGGAAIDAVSGAHHWRLYGLALTTEMYNGGLLRIGGDGTQTSADDLPHHIDVVQCLVSAHPERGGKRGVQANGRYVTIRDSHVSGWTSDHQDSQAICGWSCQYVWLLNNYVEATGENIFLGEYSQIPNFWPSDVVIARNHLRKRPEWRGALGTNGKPLVIKNLLELKSGVRVHIHGNVLENCWSQGQKGYAFNIKPGSEAKTNAPTTKDVVIERNLISNVEMAANVTGQQPARETPTARYLAGSCSDVVFRHNAFLGMDVTAWAIQHAGGPINDVTWECNTFEFSSGKPLLYLPITKEGTSHGLRFIGNTAPNALVKADGTAVGAPSLIAAYGSEYIFEAGAGCDRYVVDAATAGVMV